MESSDDGAFSLTSDSDGTTTDADEMDAAFAAIGDLDADLAFFNGLFEDDKSELKGESESAGRVGNRGDRRRQRWHHVDTASTQDALSHYDFKHEWAEMAKNQRREREIVEKENAKLRKLLKSQNKTIQKVFRLTQRASTIAATLGSSMETEYLGPTIDLAQTNKELDAIAEEARVVLSAGRFVDTSARFRDVRFNQCETETGVAIEMIVEVAWFLPFNVDKVAKVLWTHSATATPKDKILRTTMVYNDSELLVSHVVAAPKEEDGKAAVAHVHTATRRYPPRPDGSDLIVLTNQGRFVLNQTTWVGSVQGDGFLLVSAVPGHDSVALGPLSRVAWCRRNRAQPPAVSNMTPAERSRWIDSAVKGPMRNSDQKIDNVIQAIENLLLTPTADKAQD